MCPTVKKKFQISTKNRKPPLFNLNGCSLMIIKIRVIFHLPIWHQFLVGDFAGDDRTTGENNDPSRVMIGGR